MMQAEIHTAATTLWQHWQERRRMAALPESVRPSSSAEGYAIQAHLTTLSGQRVIGWKIAATSPAGQAHIRVDGPIGGRLLQGRVLGEGAAISLDRNLMRVAEAEFAFMLGRDLPRRERAYEIDEVMTAVSALHLAIEVPDSRYEDFTVVGAPQLIADDACACWFILGREVTANWRASDLSQHPVAGHKNGAIASSGSGANVLGDPRLALTWMANEMRQFGDGLEAGQFVTTGTCIVPIPIAPGDEVRMDFGAFGTVEATLTS
jgi:2-keto-4-pentenoate hydratase